MCSKTFDRSSEITWLRRTFLLVESNSQVKNPNDAFWLSLKTIAIQIPKVMILGMTMPRAFPGCSTTNA